MHIYRINWLLGVLLLFTTVTVAQSPIQPFQRIIKDNALPNGQLSVLTSASGLDPISNGLFLITGEYHQDPINCIGFNTEGLVARINSSGFIFNSWRFKVGIGENATRGGASLNDGSFLIQGIYNKLIYIIRYSPQGASLWGARLGTPSLNFLSPTTTSQMANEDILLTGSIVTGSGNPESAFLIRVDSYSGTPMFSVQISSNADDGFYAAKETNDGILCIGYTNALSPTNIYPLLVKYNKDGSPQWSKTYSYPLPLYSKRKQIPIAVNQDGSILFAFRDSSLITNLTNIVLTKLTPNGDVVWANRYFSSTSLEPNHLTITSDEQILLSGAASSSINGIEDVTGIVMKVSQTGNVIAARRVGNELDNQTVSPSLNTKEELLSSIEVQENGCTGYFLTGLIDRGYPSAPCYPFGGGRDRDIWFVKLNENLEGFTLDCFDAQFDLFRTELSPSDIVIGSWGSFDTLTLAQLAVVDTLTPNPIFTAPRGNCDSIPSTSCIVGTDNLDYYDPLIRVFPNPSNDEINLVGIDIPEIRSVRLFSIDGKEVSMNIRRLASGTINLSTESKGLMLLQIQLLNGVNISRRIVFN